MHGGELGRHGHYYLVTLEYGRDYDAEPDPFNVTRMERHDYTRAAESYGLDPIVRRFAGGDLVAEHHVIEDFLSEWREDVHHDAAAGVLLSRSRPRRRARAVERRRLGAADQTRHSGQWTCDAILRRWQPLPTPGARDQNGDAERCCCELFIEHLVLFLCLGR